MLLLSTIYIVLVFTIFPRDTAATQEKVDNCISTPTGCSICDADGSECIGCQNAFRDHDDRGGHPPTPIGRIGVGGDDTQPFQRLFKGSCVSSCYNAAFLYAGASTRCTRYCPHGLIVPTGNAAGNSNQYTCVGVQHYSSRCTGPVLGPVGQSVEELECTKYDFRLDNLHETSLDKPPACGRNKCFFRSRHDPKIGYVVLPFNADTKTGKHAQWLLTKQYPFAEMLAAKYHVRHGIIAPPKVIDVSEQFAKELGKGIGGLHPKLHQKKLIARWSKGSVQFNNGRFWKYGERYWSYVVQRVEAAPPNAFFIKVWNYKHNRAHEESDTNVVKFVAMQTNATVLSNLHQDLLYAATMIGSERSLEQDFQMMLEPDTGHLIHFDLDPIIEHTKTKYQNLIEHQLATWAAETNKRLHQLRDGHNIK